MESYYVTVFNTGGETLLNERFEAADDEEAKEKGRGLLKEKQFLEHTHRVVHSSGKIIVFRS
ncbi:YhzD family protein [Bacillus paralicheniformis]|uniref:YhzD family protein n=1 Tax=Bacillus paralicheniformis TaxID=1648923 RepID=UPI001BDF2BFB|nr:YhzD family protein [Bacillus paralicheniformis]MDR9798713.1 YhzD family protein [Bacillus paralicheniformis]